jgi:hypothetical protein
VYLLLDDSQSGTRGKRMEAVAKMQDPTTEAYRRDHQYVCDTRLLRQQVIPGGIRRSVKKEVCGAVGVLFRQTTELAAHLMQEFDAPVGVQVWVLFDAYNLCHTVVKACREKLYLT